MWFKKYLPIASWLPTYNKTQLRGDLYAGLTVGVMLIPQGMAYGMLAGLPPIHGLYAVTLPLFLYAIFGTSRQLAVGPVAMVSLLTAAGISALQPSSPAQYLLYVITLAFLVGLVQLLMGVLRLGFLVNFLSHPVISGFTSAAAIIIGLSQLKHLLGIKLPNTEYIQEIGLALATNIKEVHWLTLIIGLIAVVIIKTGKKISKTLPTSLIAVVLSIIVVWGFGLTDYGVKIVGNVPSGLPYFSLPTFSPALWESLIPVVMTISLVGFMESFAVAKAIQAKHKDYTINANQELIALGIANLGAAIVQSYPVTGGFSRTAVNDQAGAKTGMASILAALLIVLTLLFLTPLFYYLPNAVLAAVVLVAVLGLIDYKEARLLWKRDKNDFWMFMATFVATLTLGIDTGIGLGVLLSLGMVIYRSTRPHVAILGKVPNSRFYRNIQRFSNLEQRIDIGIVRFDGPLYFANIGYFKEKLDQLKQDKGADLRLLVINCESMNYVDSSSLHAIKEWVDEYRLQHIKIYFTAMIGPVRDAFARWNLVSYIGEDHFFIGNQEAIEAFDQQSSDNQTFLHPYVMQHNAL